LADELLQKNTHPIVQEKIIKTISQINNPKAVHAYLELLGDKKVEQGNKDSNFRITFETKKTSYLLGRTCVFSASSFTCFKCKYLKKQIIVIL